MRRFSIGKLMAFVALAAANFWVVRSLLVPSARPDATRQSLVGLLPLLDAVAVSIYLVATRYRVTVRRLGSGERGRFSVWFAAWGIFLLVGLFAVWWFAPGAIIDYFEWLGAPADRFLRSIGVDTVSDTALLRYGLFPRFMGLILSGPPLLLATVLAAFTSRYRIVVTPRQEDTP